MVNMTGSIAATATAVVLAAGLGSGGSFGVGASRPSHWANGNNMTTTSTPIIIENSTVSDNGQDFVIPTLPLCSALNTTSNLYYKGGGGTTTSGGLGVPGTPSTISSDTNINGGGVSIFDETGFFGGDNESQLIYGTDSGTIMMTNDGGGAGNFPASGRSSGRHPSRNVSNELTIEDVKYFTYGILWPTICGLGIIGNVLNLIVLNQPNMKGTAYIYMRG